MPFVVLLLCAVAAIQEQKIYNEENKIICIIAICDSHVYVPYNSFMISFIPTLIIHVKCMGGRKDHVCN